MSHLHIAGLAAVALAACAATSPAPAQQLPQNAGEMVAWCDTNELDQVDACMDEVIGEVRLGAEFLDNVCPPDAEGDDLFTAVEVLIWIEDQPERHGEPWRALVKEAIVDLYPCG